MSRTNVDYESSGAQVAPGKVSPRAYVGQSKWKNVQPALIGSNMKIETCSGKYILPALLVWLAAAPLVQAFYNPNTGRWLSRDPIGERGGGALYSFCANSPLNVVDPFGLTPTSEVAGVMSKEIHRVESDLSFLAYTTHYPPYLRRLERLLPRISVRNGDPMGDGTPLYDPKTDTLTGLTGRMGTAGVVHELTHAHTDINLGFDPYWDDKKDEGIAWVVDKFPMISTTLIGMGNTLLRHDCNRNAVKKQWTLLWRNWGTFAGSWSVFSWQNPIGGTERIGSKQITDTINATGVKLSCRDVKARVNALLDGCCFRVICNQSERISERDIDPGVSIDPVFE